MNDIREMFPSYRWRWTGDHYNGTRFDPYHVELHGRYGKVYLHGETGGVRLQAYTDRKLIRGRLLAIPNVVAHQVGDTEATVIFTPEDSAPVFALLRIRRKGGSGRFPRGESPENATDGEEPSDGVAECQ